MLYTSRSWKGDWTCCCHRAARAPQAGSNEALRRRYNELERKADSVLGEGWEATAEALRARLGAAADGPGPGPAPRSLLAAASAALARLEVTAKALRLSSAAAARAAADARGGAEAQLAGARDAIGRLDGRIAELEGFQSELIGLLCDGAWVDEEGGLERGGGRASS